MYDYADLNVPMLARMFDRRCAGYEAVGYTVLIPGSAVPGRPAEVMLPGGSALEERICRQRTSSCPRRRERSVGPAICTCRPAAGACEEGSGSARAPPRRFSTDALRLYQKRLAALREPELPIPFDGGGNIEVDLLCAEARLVVELDGGQHLENRDAYRRDRRKDVLLQERGYFVLRFLAEDVGTRLDMVLDAILRALSHRRASAGDC